MVNGFAEVSGQAPADRADEGGARPSTLRVAADAGWEDLDEGRYREVEPAELESFIHSLGGRSSKDVAHPPR